MRLYVSTAKERFVDGVGVPNPLTDLGALRATTKALEVQFLNGDDAGTPARLPSGALLKCMIKPAGKYEADPLAQVVDAGWTRPGSDSGFYTANLNLNTDEINALLATPDGDETNDKASVTAMLVFVWILSGESNPRGVLALPITINNLGFTDSEGVAAAAVPGLGTRVTTLEAAAPKSGGHPVGSGASSLALTFPVPFGSPPSIVLAQLLPPAGSGGIMCWPEVDTILATGCNIVFGAETPNPNYTLAWAAFP